MALKLWQISKTTHYRKCFALPFDIAFVYCLFEDVMIWWLSFIYFREEGVDVVLYTLSLMKTVKDLVVHMDKQFYQFLQVVN